VVFFQEPEYAAALRKGEPPPAASPAGEQYALAALLWLLFSGAHTHDFKLAREEMLRQIAEEPPRSFESPWPEAEAVLGRALAKDPGERFQSMNDMAQALQVVYRQYVGAGSTQPLASPPQSGFVAVPSGQISAQGGAVATPLPTVPPQGYSNMLAAQPPQPSSAVSAQSAFASSVPPPAVKSGRRGLIIGIVLFLVLGGGGTAAWYFLVGPGHHPQVAQAAATRKQRPTPEAEPAKQPAKQPVAAPVAEPPKDPVVEPASGSGSGSGSGSVAAPEPPARRIRVQIETKPGGAAIYDGDTLLDKTPGLVRLEQGKSMTVVLRLEGYEDEELVLDGAQLKIRRTLTKEKHHHPAVTHPRPDDPRPPTTPITLPDSPAGHNHPPSDRCLWNPALKRNDPDCLE
jgi:hypothetical protein